MIAGGPLLTANHSVSLLSSSAATLSGPFAPTGAPDICSCDMERNEPFPQLQHQQQVQHLATHASFFYFVPIDRWVVADDGVIPHHQHQLQQHLQNLVQEKQKQHLTSSSFKKDASVTHGIPTNSIKERNTCEEELNFDAIYTFDDGGALSI